MGRKPPRVHCSACRWLPNWMISFCELSSSGYLVPIMVTYVSSDTLALLGKIRDRFCFPAVPAAWRKVLACSGNRSGASDSHKTVTAAQQHGVMLTSQLLPIVSLHRTWKKAALSADKLSGCKVLSCSSRVNPAPWGPGMSCTYGWTMAPSICGGKNVVSPPSRRWASSSVCA